MSGMVADGSVSHQEHLDIALFLMLAFGYAMGLLRIRPIPLSGTLLTAQFDIPPVGSVKNSLFMLFILALSDAGKPQFSANRNAQRLPLNHEPAAGLTAIIVSAQLAMPRHCSATQSLMPSRMGAAIWPSRAC